MPIKRIRNDPPEVRRARNFKGRYGMSETELAVILERQGGKCAICREAPGKPCVDHDHATGDVRGILCHRCNIFLSAVEDRAFRESALAYLEKYSNPAWAVPVVRWIGERMQAVDEIMEAHEASRQG